MDGDWFYCFEDVVFLGLRLQVLLLTLLADGNDLVLEAPGNVS